jgi:cytochrome c oxidase subunit 1/cytochrome c oxidase subunit I+III
MPRRIYTYSAASGWGGWNGIETIGAGLLSVGILVSVWNLLRSLHGPVAGRNPWNAPTLEWETTSPPPAYGSEVVPLVATPLPLWDDFDEHADPAGDRTLEHARVAAVTTVARAAPMGVAKMPEDTLTPLWLTLGLTALFAALLLKALAVALVAMLWSLGMTAAWLWPEPERSVA